MADYRSSVDLQNLKDYSRSATNDTSQALAQMLQHQADQSQQQSQFTQGHQNDLENMQKKSDLGKEEQERNLGLAQRGIEDNAKAGRNLSYKVGDVDIKQQEDSPLKYLMHSQQAGAHAQSHAYDTYMKAFPEVQKRAQSSMEGLEAINDPNQIGSVGQAKTLMIKNLGMNRYNEQEGNALVPKQLSQVIHGIYNGTFGDDNPLTDTQRQALNTVFQGGLSIAKKQHEMAKNNAVGSLVHSGIADPNTIQQFKSSIGSDFDKQLNDITDKYKAVPTTSGYQPGAAAKQPVSMIDKLRSLFGNQQSPAAQAPQSDPASRLKYLQDKKAGLVK